MTVQAALQRLRSEQLVYSTGRGYFVGAPNATPTVDERLQEVEAELRELRARIESLESSR